MGILESVKVLFVGALCCTYTARNGAFTQCNLYHLDSLLWLALCTGHSSVVYLLLSCTGMTGRLGVLFHVQNTVRWLALSIRQLEAPQMLCLSSCSCSLKIVAMIQSILTTLTDSTTLYTFRNMLVPANHIGFTKLLHEQSVRHIANKAEITYCTGHSSVVYLLLSCTGITGRLGVLSHAQKLLKCCVSHHAAVL